MTSLSINLVGALDPLGPVAFISKRLRDYPAGLAVVIAALVLSLAFHEAAHAWAAHRLGDDTAKRMGRLTLNPIAHIDLVNTIILPAVMIAMMGWIFGGAKPVPVNPSNFRHPLRDNAIVALAGPASNLLLAFLTMIAFYAVVKSGAWEGKMLPDLLGAIVSFNVLLAVFNLIPIPPLDGSRVVTWLLPADARQAYGALEQFGILLILGLIVFVRPFQIALVTTIESVNYFLLDLVRLWGLW